MWETAAAEFEPPPDDVFDKLGVAPNPGPQSRFLSLPDENLDVLFGGAVGGSKSFSLLLYALRACVRYPGLQAFWFRRTFPELQQSVLRQLARLGYASKLGAKWNGSTYELRFPGGSVLTFGHAKNMQEASALLSAEINLLLIDERTTIPPDVVDMLYTRVRSGVPGVPVLGIRSATNPGDVGHSRVLADYIEATEHGEKEITDANARRRIFIQSRISDTPQLGADYLRNLAGLPEKLRKAYLEGDWSVFAGQVFDEWRYERHVVKPFTIPASWQRYNGIDWGYAAPWCVLWAAVDEDGRAWFYRELYATQVGETEQAKRILAAEEGDATTLARYADDAMWATRGEEKSIADVYADNGVHLDRAGKGAGSRIARVQRMHTYLGEAPACRHHRDLGWETCPRAHFFTNCPNLIRTLPTVPHAKKGSPEDVDTDSEDHAYDGATYLLANLGTGPQFPVDDDPPADRAEDLLDSFAGQFAVRPEQGTAPWNRPPADDDEGKPPKGATQKSPFV
jgi:hypothetical protein